MVLNPAEPGTAPLTEEEMVKRLRELIVELEQQRNSAVTKNRLLRAIERISWRFWRGDADPVEEPLSGPRASQREAPR